MSNGIATTNTASTVTQDTLGGGTDIVGNVTGKESNLSNWAGDYVTDMLGQGKALGEQGYNAYMGPLTAGESDLQTQAFEGIGGFTLPDQMGVEGYQPQQFTGDIAQQYMNPYLQASLDPQIAEARRQSEIDRVNNASRMTQAGSFGGSRQAVMDAQNQGNLQRNLAGITGQGYADAYSQAMNQFNTEQDRGMSAQDKINLYGSTGIQGLADMGAVQRGIESEGVTADRMQFEEERDFPYKQVQYMQSLLQGLPIEAQSVNYAQPSKLSEILSGAGGLGSLYDTIFGGKAEAAE
jgi:hypothetical protein|tara:strand:- start:973 stop:1854 length:882 start_codon:yes stop_codon:yes gene_type:complete